MSAARPTRIYDLLSASSLVKKDDPVELRIKEAPVRRADTASGTTVQEDDGLAVGVTALFVAVADRVQVTFERMVTMCRSEETH
jgi:hypothetical protein